MGSEGRGQMGQMSWSAGQTPIPYRESGVSAALKVRGDRGWGQEAESRASDYSEDGPSGVWV